MEGAARRHFAVSYRRWIEADVAWQRAVSEAAVLVPAVRTRLSWQIGQPGSPVRRAWEVRARALDALYAARRAHLEALHGVRKRHGSVTVVLRLPMPGGGSPSP